MIRLGHALRVATPCALAVLLLGCSSGTATSAKSMVRESCQQHVSVNGLRTDDVLQRYETGAADAVAAARTNAQWRQFAAEYQTFLQMNRDLVAGRLTLTNRVRLQPGIQAGQAVADVCRGLGYTG